MGVCTLRGYVAVCTCAHVYVRNVRNVHCVYCVHTHVYKYTTYSCTHTYVAYVCNACIYVIGL